MRTFRGGRLLPGYRISKLLQSGTLIKSRDIVSQAVVASGSEIRDFKPYSYYLEYS